LIDVLVVDPAVRVGLVVLRVGHRGDRSRAGRRDALEPAGATRPDVALVDYELGEGNGLAVLRGGARGRSDGLLDKETPPRSSSPPSARSRLAAGAAGA
jgi:hypothetical protein